MRDRGSFWSLDQQQQQQQQPGICLDLSTFYGIVSYAVGVSLIMTISGIKSGRRFFLLHRRHSGRRSGHNLGYGRANHRPFAAAAGAAGGAGAGQSRGWPGFGPLVFDRGS
jgi:hypothetical protein